MKAFAKLGIALGFIGIASAVDLKVEAVVIDLPNTRADKLVEEGRGGEAKPWAALISPDGSLKGNEDATLVARFEVTRFEGGKGVQDIKHEEEGGLQSNYHYSVDAKDPALSRRVLILWDGPKADPKKPDHSSRIQLSSPLTREWTFSARYRTAANSRIILEKASVLPDFEKASSKWMAFRFLEQEKPVSKRKATLGTRNFAADQDETERVEWRFRDLPAVDLAFTNSVRPPGTAVPFAVETDDESAHQSDFRFKRTSGKYTCRVWDSLPLEKKGKNVQRLYTEVSVFPSDAETAPFAVRLPSTQAVQTLKGRVGSGEARRSKIAAEWIGE